MATWYDKYRKCDKRSGGTHEGKLELMTSNGMEDGEELGWGGVVIEEAEEHRQTFLTKYKGDEEAFYEYWPHGFRWTCCGCRGDSSWCDHHGTGRFKCTCDFCVAGAPQPDSIYLKEDIGRRGLTLPRGPDPRSYNPLCAGLNEVGRAVCGMDPIVRPTATASTTTVPSKKCRKCSKTKMEVPSIFRCAKCRIVYYCSKDCQVGDWKEHKKQCRHSLKDR
mmetsp:Transcript_10252/g.16790  ORF Transcript_10252/g.16790 Transcript_10252/m.16790 type:complete len:220 (-) Transcript_10252:33-692(-)